MNKNLRKIISFVLVVCLLLSATIMNFSYQAVVQAATKDSVVSAFQNAIGTTLEGYKYNFNSDASGLNLVTGTTAFKNKISTAVGNSSSFMKVTSSKTARFEGFTQFYTENRWNCASSISFDLKMASSSEDFSGFYIKYGNEIPSGASKNIVFFSNDGVRADSSNSITGTTGIGFSFRTINGRTCIEIFVKYLNSNGKLSVSSQFFYDEVSNLSSFNNYKIVDDNAGNIIFYVNDNVLATLVCSNAKIPTRNTSYKEKYYNTVKILDKNNSTLATVSHALVSTESALAFGTRNEILELDNLEILDIVSADQPVIDGCSVSISNSIAVNYFVFKNKFDSAGFVDPTLKAVFNGKTYEMKPKVATVNNTPCYVFTFENVTPQMMNDIISTTLSAKRDGEVCESNTAEYSVAKYAYSQLQSTQSAKLRRLLVDLLEYGSASQIYKNHNKLNLADANLTAEQKLWGTQELRTLVNSAVLSPDNDGASSVDWKGMRLSLEDIVSIVGVFEAESAEGLSVKVTNAENTVISVIKGNGLSVAEGSDGMVEVTFKFDNISVSQMSEAFGFTVYDENGQDLGGTYIYSIESYVQKNYESANSTLAELLKAMIFYGDSAYNYLTAVEEPSVTEEKAKVILLCGQSNAAGVSPIMYIESAVGTQRANAFASGIQNVKIVYNVSTTGSEINKNETLEVVRSGQGWHNNRQYFGPELGIAEYLSSVYPGEKIYIVKHAIGSSTIGDYMPNDPISDFISGVTDTVKYNSYGELKRVFDLAVPQIKIDSGLDPEVVGICWVQGESEAAMGDAFANTYKARQEKLISNFRRDYAAYAPANGIAFFDATIANTVAPGSSTPVWPLYAKVNEAKNQIAAADDMCFIVDVNANGVGCSGVPDYYHYDAASMIKLGRLFGEKIVEAINKN